VGAEQGQYLLAQGERQVANESAHGGV